VRQDNKEQGIPQAMAGIFQPGSLLVRGILIRVLVRDGKLEERE